MQAGGCLQAKIDINLVKKQKSNQIKSNRTKEERGLWAGKVVALQLVLFIFILFLFLFLSLFYFFALSPWSFSSLLNSDYYYEYEYDNNWHLLFEDLNIFPLVDFYFFLFDFEFPSDAAQHLLNGHTLEGAFVLLDWGLISSILFDFLFYRIISFTLSWFFLLLFSIIFYYF